MKFMNDKNKFANDLKYQIAELPNMKRGLLMSVLRKAGADCSNGGVTTESDHVLCVFVTIESLPFDIPSSKGKHRVPPTLYIINRHMFNECDDWVAYPTSEAALQALHCGNSPFMFGGNFVTSFDSRTPFKYPIPVHDRKE